MEEIREQPTVETNNIKNDFVEQESCDVGSQDASLGKFKSVQALMDAYENLQSEFTRKCQQLSQYQQDKTEQAKDEQKQNLEEKKEDEKNGFNQEVFKLFLEDNGEAKMYEEEILKRFSNSSSKGYSPYEIAWADVILNHLKEGDKISDPIINQYVLSDENVKNKIIENYLTELKNSRPPIMISSSQGERVASVKPDNPKTLADAKRLLGEMFS